jgi:hypothetical protein
MPPEVMGYIYPSRYCQSDRLIKLANNEFGKLPQGYGRVQAIRDWVNRHIKFTMNSSNSNTSAVDSIIEQVGVCRDFAHLMIALCRAINIPARFATGTDYGADPMLGPSDFHAYVEVYLGYRWYIFDPSGTGIPPGLCAFRYRARRGRRSLCHRLWRRSERMRRLFVRSPLPIWRMVWCFPAIVRKQFRPTAASTSCSGQLGGQQPASRYCGSWPEGISAGFIAPIFVWRPLALP